MSSSPYQSRLLSFLNRQSLRWRDRFGKTSRRLKVAAEWGVQMLVYPVYLLVQTGRFFGKKLEQSAVNPQLTALEADKTNVPPEIPSDQPIAEILALIDPWVVKEDQTLLSAATPTIEQLSTQIQQRVQTVLATRQEGNVLSQLSSQIQKAIAGDNQGKLEIQGVANGLESQKLVLVANNNQTFDVLTNEQQTTLDKRIRTELGNYYYEKRLYRLVGQHFPSLIPQFTEKDQNVSPPVRWFWRTMRWIQTSDVATSLNLFGESELIHPPSVSKQKKIFDNSDFPQGEWGKRETIPLVESKSPDLSHLRQLIYSAIDYFYGGLQKSPLGNSQLVQQLPEASAIIQEKLQETAKISQQKLLKPAKAQLKHLKQQISSNPDDPFRLQVLIEAAIAHFFAQSSLTLQQKQQRQLKSSLNEIKEPWLTTEDLFPSPTLENFQSSLLAKTSTASDVSLTLNEVAKTQPLQSQSLATAHRNADLWEIASFSTPKVETSSTLIQVKDEEISVDNSLDKRQSSPQSMDVYPDWIETEVQAIGYVKHPLERLLKGLDQGILWLEEKLVKLVKKLLKLWKHFVS